MTQDRWDSHFLHLSLQIALMSKDPATQVGAIIVGPDREIRSSGFNGFPRGIVDSDDRLNDRNVKLQLIVHAEVNAILNAARIGTTLKGTTLYLSATDHTGMVWSGPPCTRCTVEIIQSGIIEIVARPFKRVASKWKEDIETSRKILQEAGIIYREVMKEK